MCFNAKNCVLRTAKKDIEVWKVITKLNKPSVQRDSSITYIPFKTFRLRKKLKKYKGDVYRGFHSYRSRDRAFLRCSHFVGCGYKVVRFYIPKGAKYYRNATQYVSTSIKADNLENVR